MGGDIYDEALTDTAPWAGLEALYKAARAHGKPFSVPEAGLSSVDDPAFVRHMCSFLSTHPATEMHGFYESKPGSEWDLGSKPTEPRRLPDVHDTARREASRVGGCERARRRGDREGAEADAATGRRGGAARRHVRDHGEADASRSSSGCSSSTTARRPAAPARRRRPSGTPTSRDGVYPATLIVFPFPPFTTANARFYTSADVTVGTSAAPVVSFEPTPDSGPAPLSVSFRTELDLTGPVTSWEMVFGDGKTRDGTGAPPHFAGHTFTEAGDYSVLLVVNQSGDRRFMALAAISRRWRWRWWRRRWRRRRRRRRHRAARDRDQDRNGARERPDRSPAGRSPTTRSSTSRRARSRSRPTRASSRSTARAACPAKFKLVRGTDKGKPIVELQLKGGNFSVCPKRKTSSAAATTPTTVRQLWGDGKGKFRTKGRYSSATVRGTNWLTADRCDGTFTRSGAASSRCAT